MKKRLLLFMLMALPFVSFAQTVDEGAAERQAVERQVQEQLCYMYNIVIFHGGMNNEWLDVDIDNGRKIKTLKDSDGKKIKFKTPAAALMYFISEGWELYVNDNNTNPNGSTSTYWIIRKPCTKAEFDAAVQGGIK